MILVRRFLPIGVLLALFAAGCTGKPEEQIKLAEKAMQQAKEQRAAEFAPDEWRQGQEAWDEAQAKIQKGEYGGVSTTLLKAKTRFERARDLAQGKREALLREVQGRQKTVDLRYQRVKENMQTAKLSPQTRKELEETFAEIDKSITKFKEQMDQGDYTQADLTAQNAMHQVYSAEKTLKGAGK
jgi:hypothetical protein